MKPSRLGEGAIRRILNRLPLVLAPFVVVASLATPAWAKGPAVIVKVHQASGLISPYFQLTSAPGATVRAGALEIVNPTSSTVSARLDPVNAITTNTLGSAYAMRNVAGHGATTWLRLSRQNVKIAPHGSESVSVSLAVPALANPGDYLAGVSVEALGQSQATTVNKGVAIGEIDRYAIGVEVKLSGPRHPAVSFTGASVAREPGGLAFLLAASNTGNVILKNVHGWVRVTNGNRLVGAATIQPGTFVSATSISYPLLTPREEPVPGASYRVRAALYYAGGVARLDKTVRFSHAAAVTQQNYGGRKLPASTFPWRWLVLLLFVLIAAAATRVMLERRRRPLSPAAAVKLLDRCLAPSGSLPVSVVLVKGDRGAMGEIAQAIRPRLRRTDRLCDLGREGLLVICPSTGRPPANALRRDLYEHLARHNHLADRPIEITVSTALKPTTARKLLERVKAPRRSRGRRIDRQPAASRER